MLPNSSSHHFADISLFYPKHGLPLGLLTSTARIGQESSAMIIIAPGGFP
jgi:hypothetical protein